MTVDLVVVGAGGFGRETLDVIEARNALSVGDEWHVLGVVDDRPSTENSARLAARGYAVLGTIDEVLGAHDPGRYVLGIGSPAVKAAVAVRFDAAGWQATSVIHPGATVGSRVVVGAGSVICGGVQLSTNTVLGRHVHLNPGAIVGHDGVLGDRTSVNPGAVVSGEVEIGAGVLVGAGAVILQGLSVGAESTIGAAACVTRSVSPRTTVVGVPARPIHEREPRT